MRVTMTALDRIYSFRRRRGFLELFPRSIALGLAIGIAVVGALAVVRFVPLLTGDLDGVLAVLSFLARWLIAASLLGVGVALVVRYGTAARQTLPWVSYASVFGHLATFFVLLLYVYASSVAFLAGIQTDACVRERAKGG